MNMAFSLTTAQMRERSKTVTRRMGWEYLLPADLLQAVVQGMGLKKGEKVEKLGVIRVVDVRREPVNSILDNPADLVREGFPNMPPAQFVTMFCEAHHCLPTTIITRIEFQHLEQYGAVHSLRRTVTRSVCGRVQTTIGSTEFSFSLRHDGLVIRARHSRRPVMLAFSTILERSKIQFDLPLQEKLI
jgi:hypothetical protein